MTRREIVEVLRRDKDDELTALATIIDSGTPVEEVLLNGLLIARQAWKFLSGRVKLVEEREKIVTFLKSSAFAHDDVYIARVIRSLEAGDPVIFTLLQCILLLTTERTRMLRELIALKSVTPMHMVILKEEAEQSVKDRWPQPMPEPPDVLFYKPEDDDDG